MLSSYKGTFGYKFCDCTEKQNKKEIFISLLKDLEVQSFLKEFIDAAIATSELNILKRITALEEQLGIIESEVPTIPERLEKLEEKVNTSIFTFVPPVEPEIQPTTKTEERAVSLVEYAKETGKDHLTHHEITSFLKSKLPDNIQNIRKVKQDVLKKAASMYPNVFLSKKSTGHREVRLVLAS